MEGEMEITFDTLFEALGKVIKGIARVIVWLFCLKRFSYFDKKAFIAHFNMLASIHYKLFFHKYIEIIKSASRLHDNPNNPIHFRFKDHLKFNLKFQF